MVLGCLIQAPAGRQPGGGRAPTLERSTHSATTSNAWVILDHLDEDAALGLGGPGDRFATPEHPHHGRPHGHLKQLDFEQAAQCFARALAMAPHTLNAAPAWPTACGAWAGSAEAAPYWEEILGADPRNQQGADPGLGHPATSGWASWTGPTSSTGPWTSATTARRAGPGADPPQARDFPEAVRSYDRILARNPGHARTLLLLAKALERWQGPAAAAAYLDQQRVPTRKGWNESFD